MHLCGYVFESNMSMKHTDKFCFKFRSPGLKGRGWLCNLI